jgi:hypothetical protein
MASPAAQAKANALNAKIEVAAGQVLDDIERNYIRKVARESFSCALKCYDKAGKSGKADALQACAQNCQIPYQQTNNMVQQVRFDYIYFCPLDGQVKTIHPFKTHLDLFSFFPKLDECHKQEVAQFQNRLSRNMSECQESARDMMTPGIENDTRKMDKVEGVLLSCISKTVDQGILQLNPMKDRIATALQNFK